MGNEGKRSKPLRVNRAFGRRKTSVAQVRLIPLGGGKVLVNKRALEHYFRKSTDRKTALQPLESTGLLHHFDVLVKVEGGGTTGQAGAMSLGVARALVDYDGNLRPALSREKLLTRDPRMVERKKYGQPGARRRYQFSKR